MTEEYTPMTTLIRPLYETTRHPLTLTSHGVSIFRLLSLRGQLKLEKVGMKSSGGALRPRLAAEFGLTVRASHDLYIAAVQKQINVLEQAMLEEARARDQKPVQPQ